MKWILFLLGIILISMGMLVHYLWGYKDGWLIEGSFTLSLIFGWLCLLFLLVLHHPASRKKNATHATTSTKILHIIYFICYPLWLVLLVCLFLYTDHLLDQRVATILNSDAVGYTTATVTDIEERRSKTGVKYYAMVEYHTPEGYVKQAIREQEGTYTQGQRMIIKYAQQYPDMFKVVDAFILPNR